MPQGGRKTPFSGKAKKQQLQAKKTRKAQCSFDSQHDGLNSGSASSSQTVLAYGGDNAEILNVNKLNEQPSRERNVNRYVLQFQQESKEEIRQRKELAHHALIAVSEEEMEVDPDSLYPPVLDFPKRPPWDSSMSRDVLEAKEQKYFREYVDNLSNKIPLSELSYFEMNLETWRQLWRVLEMSDIVLVIVDIRYPVHLFPPSLYNHVTQNLGKSMILVLNKIDLAPAPLVLAWKTFFSSRYPTLQVLMFTSFPGYNLRGTASKAGGLQVLRRRGKMRMSAEGAQQLLKACERVVGDEVDLSSWSRKISTELSVDFENEELEVDERIETKKVDTSFVKHERYHGGVLTIGCVGQPNVGKSSLMNAIMGKKVVSVSRTPGHTKHFQTIYLTSNVRLCDCPGLVFPSKVPRTLQVLMGSFPIAQVREPFSCVQYIAQRMNLPAILRLEHEEKDTEWSAMDVCEAWARKRGFFTAKAARLDSYRAANHILRMSLEGKLCLCLFPPKYSSTKEMWESLPELVEVKHIQAKNRCEDAEVSTSWMNLEGEDNISETESDPKTESISEDSCKSEEEGEMNTDSNKFAVLGDDD